MSGHRESPTPRILSGPVIALILIVVSVGGWWILERDQAPAPEAEKKEPIKTIAAEPSMRPAPMPAAPPSERAPVANPGNPAPEAITLSPEDEKKIDAWLTGFDDTKLTAAAMLGGWSQLSEAGKVAAAPHLLNLVPDEQFESLAKILLDPGTSRSVQDILFAGLLNRDNDVKWPVILRIMEQKNHPHAADARTMLTVVLGKDYGEDWAGWRAALQSQLTRPPGS